MSKTVDSRVVEMQFDNRHFEKNVSQTMSTLDKLKQKLHLDGATKGLENINSAAGKVNMSGLGAGVEAVRMKFSALEVMGVTALANITNSAVNAGKRIVSSLTVQPITTGFNEYELKMGSIQTIMASTGESLDTVNRYLNELNEYSDKTIYSFQDMTSNIGKFTNAGVKLEDAVLAMKGISNEAAVSGANANEASRAMYNFAQALSSGYVKLIDWKSIELANMATVEFKEQLMEAAVAAGTLTEAGDGMYQTLEGNVLSATKNFNESLQDQWMTSEVLIGTLKKYADETTDIGAKATKAATEVKTFSQMMDALKESAQSGWAQTWEIVFGNFEEGKTLWTGINKVLDGMIGKMTDLRNNFLKGALTSKWEQLNEKIQKAGLSTERFQNIIKEVVGAEEVEKLTKEYGSLTNALKKGKVPVEKINEAFKKLLGTTDDNTESMEDYSDIVKKVINGDFGNGEERVKKLTEAGYNYYKVQNLVNEQLGDTFRYTEELTEVQKKNADVLADLSDEQLKNKGFTDEQIEALRELKRAADEGGTSINELINDMTKPSGRELVFETISNLAKQFNKILEATKTAWKNVFGDVNLADGLYKVIERLRDLSEQFVISEEKAKAFQTMMEGIFTTSKITLRAFGKGISSLLYIADSVLSLLGTDLLELGEYIGNVIIKFGEWIKENTVFYKYSEKVCDIIIAIITGVHDLIKTILQLDIVRNTLKRIGDIFKNLFGGLDLASLAYDVNMFIASIYDMFARLKAWVKKLDTNEVANNIIDGLLLGLESGIPTIVNGIIDLGKQLIAAFCGVLGIESPSKVFIAIGAFIAMGLAIGINETAGLVVETIASMGRTLFSAAIAAFKSGIPFVIDTIKTLSSKLLGVIKESQIDLSKLFVIGSVIGIFILMNKMTKILDAFSKPFKGIGKIGSAFESVGKSISKYFDAKKAEIVGKVILNIATAIAILAAALVALSYVDAEGLNRALWAITVITIALGGLMAVSKTMNPVEFGKISLVVIGIAGAVLLLAMAVKKLNELDIGSAWHAVGQIAALIVALIGMAAVFGKFAKGEVAMWVDQAGIMVFKIALAIGVLAVALKLMGETSWSDIAVAAGVIAGIGVLCAALVAVSHFAGEHADKAGKLIFKMALAIGIIAVAMKIIGTMSMGDIAKGLLVVGGVLLLFKSIVSVSLFAGEYAARAGWMILQMGLAIGALALAIKLISTISTHDIQKGLTVIAVTELMFMALMAMTNTVGPNASKFGGMVFKMSAGIAILALAIKLIATSSIGDIAKGMVVIGMLELMFGMLIKVTKDNGRWADRIGVMMFKMSLAIGIMAGVIALMSLLDPMDVAVGTAAISTLMLCFSAIVNATKFLKKNPVTFKSLLPLLGVVGLLAGIVAAMSLIPDPMAALATSGAVSLLLISMSAALVLLKFAGTQAMVGVGCLAVLGLVVAGLALILSLFQDLDVETTFGVVASLSVLLLSMSTALILLSVVGAGPVAIAALAGIAVLIVLVNAIYELITDFGDIVNKNPGIEDTIDKGIAILGKIGTAIGVFAGSILSGFSAGMFSGIPAIGTYLSDFMTELQPFIDGLSSENASSATENAKNLAKAILVFAAADFVSSLANFIDSGTSLEGIAKDLSGFMTEIQPFIAGCTTVTPEAMEGIKNLAEAILVLTKADLAKAFSSGFFGGDSEGISANLGTIGTNLRSFVDNLGTFDEATVTTVRCAGEALKALAEVAESLPAEGGWWQKLVGEKSLGDFGAQLPKLGSNLRGFVDSLTKDGVFDEATVATVKCAGDAIKALAEAASSIDGQAEWTKKLFGDNGLANFGAELGSLGTSLRTFVTNLGVFSADQVSTVKSAVDAVKALTGLADADLSNACVYLENFGIEIIAFADDLSEFCGKFTKTEGITTATTNLNNLVTAIADVSNANIDALKNLGTNLKALGSGCVDEFISAFTSGETANKVKKAATKLAEKVADGVETEQKSMKDAGEYLGDGLVVGINNKIDDAYDAGYALGQAAVQGEKDGQQSKSPSKLTILAGKWIGDGLIIGMKNMIGKVYSAGNNLGETATNSISSTVSRIADAINSDIDAQPTIRPVLDLSDVRSGVGSINDMLAIGSSVGVNANVSAISSMMARRGQNGGNTEVVSAINKLRKDLGNVGNTSYNINGVTYDDGSNISEAVQTIVRAARIERRV